MPRRKDSSRRNKKPANKKKVRRKENDLRAAYEWAKANFTAADLQRYTVEEKMIPMEKVIAELEKIHRRAKRKGA